jgi:hypothetical protein
MGIVDQIDMPAVAFLISLNFFPLAGYFLSPWKAPKIRFCQVIFGVNSTKMFNQEAIYMDTWKIQPVERQARWPKFLSRGDRFENDHRSE